MIQSFDEILSVKKHVKELDKVDVELKDGLHNLVNDASKLDKFQPSIMHGDLHTQNIMVRMEAGGTSPRFNFILIDLNKLNRNGDIACDIGALIADIEYHKASSRLGRELRDGFGNREDDRYFLSRVNLSTAKSKLKIAELNCRQTTSLSTIDPISKGRIINIFNNDIQPLLKSANDLIENVRNDLRV
jgi:hypothetical protein